MTEHLKGVGGFTLNFINAYNNGVFLLCVVVNELLRGIFISCPNGMDV